MTKKNKLNSTTHTASYKCNYKTICTYILLTCVVFLYACEAGVTNNESDELTLPVSLEGTHRLELTLVKEKQITKAHRDAMIKIGQYPEDQYEDIVKEWEKLVYGAPASDIDVFLNNGDCAGLLVPLNQRAAYSLDETNVANIVYDKNEAQNVKAFYKAYNLLINNFIHVDNGKVTLGGFQNPIATNFLKLLSFNVDDDGFGWVVLVSGSKAAVTLIINLSNEDITYESVSADVKIGSLSDSLLDVTDTDITAVNTYGFSVLRQGHSKKIPLGVSNERTLEKKSVYFKISLSNEQKNLLESDSCSTNNFSNTSFSFQGNLIQK